MKIKLKFRILSGVLLFCSGLVLLFGSTLVFSHGDEKHEGDTVASVDTTHNTGELDSIYSIINESYQSVRHIFEYSCFDCHSSSVSYPWYYEIPGIKGMIDNDTKEALEHLDFSNDFPFGGHANQLEQLKEIKEEIEDDAMPLMSYRMMHWGRLIEGEKRDSVFNWIDESLDLLKTTKK